MGDFYAEQLVKKKTDTKDILIKVLLLVLTVVSVLAVFMFPFGILLPVIFIVLDVFAFRWLDVEYEYLFMNGDLDVDKVMHKERRKHIFSMNINDMEVLAPSGSAELAPHKNAKVCDFSSKTQGAQTYEMVIVANGAKTRVVFEPNDAILEGMWMMAPRKVIRKK
ncbi:DUF6106 family protein [Sporofaciens sp. SGI.106]|uniref:DUF6106 family protein n=1 Tax=Sporofaciens sp. SGI.106 TaxID=3420568 RepID=UPI002A941DA0|nr:DUF6106 family protein [Lachnoclostridium sp.]